MEEWRDVPGFEGKYQISISTKEGRCRNLNYKGTGEIHEFSNTVNQNKHNKRIYWILQKDGVTITQQAARWIALTFPELVENEYFEGAHIDHIDTDRLNNHPSNLRWVTRKENNSNPLTLKHFHDSKINREDLSKPVNQYTLDGEFACWYPSTMEAERVTGARHQSIYNCCMRKKHYKTAGGFRWEWA